MDNQEQLRETIDIDPSENRLIKKRELTFKQLWNMNLGFMGIQFAWGLQMANMSPIFEYLGADAHQLPRLWLAAPLTGLIIQPIIGNLSDHTWTPLGRRRPYFLSGAILAATALILMPHSSSLAMAMGLLWVLDSSLNTSMVPFRAFVGDLLPEEQRTKGFAIQSVMVGIGSVVASGLPWVLNHYFEVDNQTSSLQPIPLTVEISFYLGAIIVLGTILWTVLTTPEHPPQDLVAFALIKQKHGGIGNSFKKCWTELRQLPPTMMQLAKAQFFTWLGVFCFFLYFPTAVAHNIFGAINQHSSLYSEGIEWAGLCFAVFNTVAIAFSSCLPYMAQKIGCQMTHCFCLMCGGISLISLLIVQNQYLLMIMMIGFGIAWSSILAMPYAMLTNSIPEEHRGIYQGIFNFFIVLPEIFASLSLGWILLNFLHSNHLLAVVLGGIFLLIGAGLTLLVESNFIADPIMKEKLL